MKIRPRRALGIEQLESRIAPAILVNPTTVTYVDSDGDAVTVKTTKGSFDLAADFVFAPSGGGEQLQTLNLASKFEFQGAKISITSTPGGGGDGKVNVGFIMAVGIDLAGVIVDGDLGRIRAGDGLFKTPGLGSLKANSMGTVGITTQEPGGDLISDVFGKLGKLEIATDVKGAALNVTGGQFGTISAVTIGNDLLGNQNPNAGSIVASGNIGPIKIGGSVSGGAVGGTNSGRIDSGGNITSIRIGGSINGGGDTGTGSINADGNLGPIFVGGNVNGGNGSQSGLIETNLGGNIASVTIVGNLFGENGADSGKIQTDSGGNIGPVKIGTAAVPVFVQGGAGARSGAIVVNDGGSLTSVTIFGSLIGGTGTNSGSIQILDAGKIGPVKISADMSGLSGFGSGSIQIFDNGSIASVTIGGTLAGGDGSQSGSIQTNNIGSIGPVKIGGGLHGFSGQSSGLIRSAQGSIASVTTGNSINGSGGFQSGSILAAVNVGPVKVGGFGNLFGSAGAISGSIIATNGNIVSVKLNGSLLGGVNAVSESGTIQSMFGTVQKVTIAKNMVGSTIAGVQSATNTGYIFGQNIGSVAIVGNIISGTDAGQFLTNSGAIRAANQLKSVSVGGDIIGNVSHRVTISGRGQLALTSTVDLAIGSVKVAGNATFANILAGYDQNGAPVNPDAQIGSVKVGGNWTSGDIAAGVVTGNAFFGDAGDASIVGIDTPVVSRIGSIVIGGTVNGTAAPGDSFGFVAEHVVSVKIGGIFIGLTPGASNDLLPGVPAGAGTGDVTILEVV